MNIKFKNNKFLHFTFEEFTFNNFVSALTRNVKLNTTYSILIKISCDNFSTFKMCGYQLGLVTKNEHDLKYYEDIYNVLITRIDITSEEYQFLGNINSIEINLFTLKPEQSLTLKNVDHLSFNTDIIKTKEIKTNFNQNLLPLTINDSLYGNNIIQSERDKYIQLIIDNNNLSKLNINIDNSDKIFIYQTPNKKEIIIISKKLEENYFLRYIFDYKTGIFLLEAKDRIIYLNNNINNSKFERTIGKTTLNIYNQKVWNYKVNINLPKIESFQNKNQQRNVRIGTFDLETFKDVDGLAKVYALGFYIKDNTNSKPNLYYLADFPNLDSKNLILKCINDMLTNKYHNHIFYVHNLGRFDIVFLYNVLLSHNLDKENNPYILDTIMRDNIIINLNIRKKIGNKYIKISLVDSLNLLNYSLDKLSKEFNLDIKKGYFPHSFVNKQTLNYKGQKPDFHFYDNVEFKEYEKIPLDNWNLRTECLKYLDRDLISLYDIMYEFSRIIFIKFNVQLVDALTITRLAVNIFKKNYIKNKNIPYINQASMFNFIKEGYYGGITEVYKPYGKNLIYIDINSLYPCGALNPMPGLECEYIEAVNNKSLDLDNLFGFFYAKVKTNNLYIGLLPININNRLVLPNGEFYGVWSSEELKFAKSKGYKIEVIRGYNFKKEENIFKDYIKELYELKKNATGSLKLIFKSLLNNFLGRFGLNIFKPITKTVDNQMKDFIFATRKVHSFKMLNEDNFLITYDNIISKEICTQHGLDYNKVLKKEFKLNNTNSKMSENEFNKFLDISITTAAFVNSYARIIINKIKLEILENGGEIFYSDTDSIVLDKKYVNPNWFSNEIGDFKLEYDIKEAFFISNKTYCLVLNNGEVITKTKGITKNSLTLNDFKEMYYKNNNIITTKNNTITNYKEAYVLIEKKNINLDSSAYNKREKLFNDEGLWTNTKPLIIYNNK